MGISRTHVRTLFSGGILVGERLEDGTFRFSAEECHALVATGKVRKAEPRTSAVGAAAHRGLVAALVFERFERGMTLADIVKELRLSPATVKDLHRDYHELRDMRADDAPPPTESERRHAERFALERERLEVKRLSVEARGREAIFGRRRKRT